jgi:hypothetical protein
MHPNFSELAKIIITGIPYWYDVDLILLAQDRSLMVVRVVPALGGPIWDNWPVDLNVKYILGHFSPIFIIPFPYDDCHVFGITRA